MFMLNLAIFCGCVLTAMAQIPAENRLNCRICDNAIDLGDCKKTAICDRTYEECYMDEVITAQLTIVYRGGCRGIDICQGTAGSATGKKRDESGELLACSRCCNRNDTDGCNKRLCGIVNPGGAERQCYACSSDQSETIQGNVVKPEDCVSFKSCAADEVCFAQSHVTGGKTTFEYGCHKNVTCKILMDKMIEDKKRCEGGNYDLCGDNESLYCFTCCGWGACNYGDCKEQNNQIYELYKKGLFDSATLTKQTSNRTATAPPATPAAATPAPTAATVPTTTPTVPTVPSTMPTVPSTPPTVPTTPMPNPPTTPTVPAVQPTQPTVPTTPATNPGSSTASGGR